MTGTQEVFYYEILATPEDEAHAEALEALIRQDPDLAPVSERWSRPSPPRQADLYALLVVVSDRLSDAAKARIRHASAWGFPLIPVVKDVRTYDFKAAPLAEVRERNAESLHDLERLRLSLRHHAGLSPFEGGGKVFISYARVDGTEIAEAIRDALHEARIGQQMDIHTIAGGERIQQEIEELIREADLMILVDSHGAGRSPWVAEEIDLALSHRKRVIAVIPPNTFRHNLQVPHVDLSASGDVGAEVVKAVRLLLGRELSFRERVERVVKQLASLRQWRVEPVGPRWRVSKKQGLDLQIGVRSTAPTMDDVDAFKGDIRPGRGVLVAGVQPLSATVAARLRRAGGPEVRVAPLPSCAATLPANDQTHPLQGKRILLSAAMPDDPEEIALARHTLAPFVVGLAQALIGLGATLVFGGHPTITPLLHRTLSLVPDDTPGRIELNHARLWKAHGGLESNVRLGPLFSSARWHGEGQEPIADVLALRDGMITADLYAGVFVGGRTQGFIGDRPGIVDEHERLGKANPGARRFIVGLAGGAARLLPSDESPLGDVLRSTPDPDLAAALIIADLIGI
jgi:hypothetical protein